MKNIDCTQEPLLHWRLSHGAVPSLKLVPENSPKKILADKGKENEANNKSKIDDFVEVIIILHIQVTKA